MSTKVAHNMDYVAEANNDLAISIHQVFASEAGNVLFCPLSISVAMAMLLRGLKGETAKEVTDVLGFESRNITQIDLHINFQKLLNRLTKEQDHYVLTIANSLFSQKQFPLVPDYTEDLKAMYDALLMEVDFATESKEAVARINEWVQSKTQDMIPKLFDSLDPSTIIVLVNAVYFKGIWVHQFDPAHTKPWKFLNYGLEEHAKDVAMMFLKKELPYTENRVFKALELPYKGKDIAMLVLLPNEMTGLRKLEQSMNSDFIKSVYTQMTEVKVEVSLPSFRLEYSKDIRSVFQALGVNRIFSTDGDFSGMSLEKGLEVSQIVHKAVLEVNEEGCKAAAVTAIVMERRCMEIIPEFLVDHPFLFVIFDKRNNMILFMGRVEEL